MKRNSASRQSLKKLAVVVMAVLLVVSAGASGVALAASTQIAITPASQSVSPGSTTTVDVVATAASEGVGSYEFTVSVDDTNVATITEIDLAGNPSTSVSSTSVASDGSSASAAVGFSDTSGTGEVVLATVTIEGQSAGDATLSIDGESVDIGTDDAEDYDIAGTLDATVTVTDSSAGDLTVEQAVASASDGDDSLIEFQEIQQAINWWATGAEVPNTGGQTIAFQEIQQLINTWAIGATVDTGSDDASIQITDTSVDGNNVTVTWQATPAESTDHVHVQLDENDYIGGQPLDGSYTFENVATGEHTVSVAVADMTHTEYANAEASDEATVTVETSSLSSSSLVEVTPDSGNIDQTTYGIGSYQVTNTGETDIVSVSFDLSTATMPDMVFDPDGTAGDPTGEGLNIVSDGGTGITTTGGGSDEAFSQPHNGNDGADGYDVMTVEFSDFQNGETATFWADNDPTSIKGSTIASQEAGPVSGLELARSTVTVTYSDGTVQTANLMGDGSVGGSTAVLDGDEAPAPTIGAAGVSLDSGVLDGYHSGATVSETSQTITVSGEPGETVTLVRVEGELSLSNVPNGGYDVEALEANNAVNVEYYTVTLDSNGEATVSVTLTDGADDDDEAGFNYFVAAHGEASGDMGDASNVVVLKYEPGSGAETVFAVNAGGPEYTATDGTVYAADTNFDGGTTFTTGSAGTPSTPEITNTDDDTLYYTERYGSFSYDVPVDNGDYDVELLFAELYQGVANDGGEGDRLFDVAIEGQQVLNDYDIYATAGGPQAATSETFTTTVDDGELNIVFSNVVDNAKISAIKITEADGNGGGSGGDDIGSADFAVNANGGIDASTFSGSSIEITNTGDKQISSVTYDLSTAAFPDVVFDPDGTAGDSTGKGFSADSGTSAVGPSGSFAAPHNGNDGADGYDELTIDFTDFDRGESFAFSTDIDPTSIKDAQGSGAAGSVSGLELSGATVTVEYADGSTQTTNLFADGSNGGSQATAKADLADAPTLGVDGVSLDSGILDSQHSGAVVTDTDQTITVSGPAGATVTLLHVEGQLELANQANGYELEAFEANTAENVDYVTATLDSNGEATVPVTLLDSTGTGAEGGFNHFIATVEDGSGDTGATSNVVVLKLGESTSEPQVLYRVNAGGSAVTATDDGPDWSADTGGSPSQYLVAGGTQTGSYGSGLNSIDDSVPSSTPTAIWNSERWDQPSGDEMAWEFADQIEAGQTYEVRLYFYDGYSGTAEPDSRVFDVNIEGATELSGFSPIAAYGDQNAGMESITVTAGSDGDIDIEFIHDVENPQINAIEIVEASA
ncbi:malectin domain-containing carbohydrate-binding protein [Halogranum rubrum]|nr:malectin domain-containing carbohydrate-binding protein [Halogranum salarium]